MLGLEKDCGDSNEAGNAEPEGKDLAGLEMSGWVAGAGSSTSLGLSCLCYPQHSLSLASERLETVSQRSQGRSMFVCNVLHIYQSLV